VAVNSVSGSGLTFEGPGIRSLEEVPGEWPLFAVANDAAA